MVILCSVSWELSRRGNVERGSCSNSSSNRPSRLNAFCHLLAIVVGRNIHTCLSQTLRFVCACCALALRCTTLWSSDHCSSTGSCSQYVLSCTKISAPPIHGSFIFAGADFSLGVTSDWGEYAGLSY